MYFRRVCLEAIGYTLPDEVVTSRELEQRLAPTYERLRLPEGRLELITGVAQRWFWSPGTLPSEKSVESARRALEVADFDPRHIGALVHGSVCRDHLEPATANRVHSQIDLPPECLVYDVSNACLGLLNGMLQVAMLIELGQIRAGLVVGTEGSRQLIETTVRTLNANQQLSRREMKLALASLTIGSGSCAVLLVDREWSRTGNQLGPVSWRARTQFHGLCTSGRDESVVDGMQPLMATDSEQLLHEGIQTGVETFARFLAKAHWSLQDVHRVFCHQVGRTHRRLMLESLGVPEERDFSIVEWLGNTGSVALPLALAIGLQQDRVRPDDNVALLGIGSGINCMMLGVTWHQTRVAGQGSVRATRSECPEAWRETASSSALAGTDSDRSAIRDQNT